MSRQTTYVVFPVAGRNCALDAARVAEVTWPTPVYRFPHTSRGVAGVVLRRGRVVPLYDLDSMLPPAGAGSALSKDPNAAESPVPSRYHLIVTRNSLPGKAEEAAFAIDGECQLVKPDFMPIDSSRHPNAPERVGDPGIGVAGELRWSGKTYVLLELEQLLAADAEALLEIPQEGGA